MAWGVRIIDSSDVYFHSMGMYSWFNNYKQYCVKREDCQQKILQIQGSENIAIYNLFTKASVEAGSGGARYELFPIHDSLATRFIRKLTGP
jgi:hypothetical protein